MPVQSSDHIRGVLVKNSETLGASDGVYNLAGMRVISGEPSLVAMRQLSQGCYVVVSKGKAKKVVVR